jgi:hypothetical protein
VVTSDHKPVWGMFEVTIRPGKDSVPLAGGLFNRKNHFLYRNYAQEVLLKNAKNLMEKQGKHFFLTLCEQRQFFSYNHEDIFSEIK